MTGVEAAVTRPEPGLLALSYVIRGAMGSVSLPPPAAPACADGLWRRTCFEAFIRAPSDEGYYEFNLSPSGQWAAYRFDGYRDGRTPADGFDGPRIEVHSTDQSLELHALLDLGRLPGLPGDTVWRIGLSAVIEEARGGLSYWALRHAPGKADFHHPDCFAIELPATGRL